ncbi:Predicted membrane protein, putative toxin regulator [Alloiococcus otitis]|uniref:Phosphotransferase system EIIC domain-containing protein n=2 Tax=Alloiococcus TaxID=1651 RepID=K9EC94_9LACT|nr:PTS sugar transporter subunit IIC [Alloiococcus otitis]EKU93421.1 hypothetical protein HMPREF9698_00953 [Alloiococcus otitis ATCC 51267]SUU81422.1 Predicted membrane protein, putative toxin regulator [Alloiococcus otitis]
MEVLIGSGLLLLFLAAFSLFTFYAPDGSKAMGALADAAVATFLVEAVFSALFGEIFDVGWLAQIGNIAGESSGAAAAGLTAMALGVSPVYAFMVSLPLYGQSILPGFIAGYLIAFLIRLMERKIPGGFDMIVILFIGPVLTYAFSMWSSGPIDGLMMQIGETINIAAETSPIIMGFLIGGLLTVVSTAPISSMAVSAMINMTGGPMAIAGLSIFGTAACNYLIFRRLKIGDQSDAIAVTVEPLTAADLVSANPIPIYTINMISGGLIGIMISLAGLINNTPGTASVVPGIIAAFAWNPPGQVVLYSVLGLIIGAVVGIVGSWAFKNYKITNREDMVQD